MNLKIALALVIIILIGTALRFSTYNMQGFVEPDNYIYYYLAQSAASNSLNIQTPVALSGFPIHDNYTEKPGLVVLPAALSAASHISVYAIMHLLPPIAGILAILLIYLFVKRFSTQRTALLAALFYAVLPAALYRNMSGEWRGESFIPLLMILALFSIAYFTEKRHAAIGRNIAFILIGISYLMWNGGIFNAAVIFWLFVLMAITYISRKSHNQRSPYPAFLAIFGIMFALLVIAIPTTLGIMPQYMAITETAPFTPAFALFYYGIIAVFALPGVYMALRKQPTNLYVQGMFVFMLMASIMQLIEIRWAALAIIPICIFGAYMIDAMLVVMDERNLKVYLMAAILGSAAVSSAIFMLGPQQTDGINPQFLATMSWIRNSTPANSSFLTLWPDGSLIEGWAHRQSYSDSMMGGMDMPMFARFLYARAGNFTYLHQVNPTYLMVRRYWLSITPAILEEGNLSPYASMNGTNFQALLNKSTTLAIAYENNDTIIYKVN